MYTYIYISNYTYTHIFIYIYTHIHLYAYIYSFKYIYITHTHTYENSCTEPRGAACGKKKVCKNQTVRSNNQVSFKPFPGVSNTTLGEVIARYAAKAQLKEQLHSNAPLLSSSSNHVQFFEVSLFCLFMFLRLFLNIHLQKARLLAMRSHAVPRGVVWPPKSPRRALRRLIVASDLTSQL